MENYEEVMVALSESIMENCLKRVVKVKGIKVAEGGFLLNHI